MLFSNPEIKDLDLSYSKAICEVKMLYIFLKLKTLSSLKCLKLNIVVITDHDQMEHEIFNLVVICNNSSCFIRTYECIII